MPTTQPGLAGSSNLWLGKLETYLETHTVDDMRNCSKHEVATPVASFRGGLLISQGDAPREHWQHFTRRLELCRQLGVQTLVLSGESLGR